MKKILFVVILFMISVVVAQKPPEAALLDEFGRVVCEDLSARTDSFYQGILANPGSRGFVVINPEIGKSKMAKVRRTLIFSRFQFRKAEDRVSFIFGDEKPSIGTAYWIIPAGATEPPIVGEKWIEPEHDLTKPFNFGYEDDLGICPTFVPRLYAELLNGNFESRGYLVVYGPTRNDRQSFVNNWLETFQKDYLIPRKRFRIFYVKQGGLAGAEFWFVPKKP